MQTLKGIPVSQGIAIGKAHVLGSNYSKLPPTYLTNEKKIPNELEKFYDAVKNAHNEIRNLKNEIKKEDLTDISSIFDAHILILSDSYLQNEVLRRITKNRMTAEYAVQCTIGELIRNIKNNPFLLPRINDLQDIERRLIKTLIGKQYEELTTIQEPVIVVAHELMPSQTATLDKNKILGFVTDIGGTTGHTAIIARTRDIPAIVGIGSLSTDILPGTQLIIDGNRGLLIIDPDESALENYKKIAADFQKFEEQLLLEKELPAVTVDGCRIFVMGNMEFPEEAESITTFGADGIGLYRTEFLYIGTQIEPDEEKHFSAYYKAIKHSGNQPIIIRTLDLGSDKNFHINGFSKNYTERNPGLGCRAIRYCLANKELFSLQIKAICRASAFGDVRLLLPMISSREEVLQAKEIIYNVQEKLASQNIAYDKNMKIGIMVEVPAVAMTLDLYCDICDFFSIGTNDLTQYALAVDRTNEKVAPLFRPEHPAMLRMLQHTIKIADYHNIPISVCGEMASDPVFVILLLGLGLKTFSVSPRQIPEVKKIIRLTSIDLAKNVANTALELSSSRDVLNYLRGIVRKVQPDWRW